MYNGNIANILIPTIGTIFGAIVGGLLSYQGSNKAQVNQLKNEQKNIANAIDIDLKNISEYLSFSFYYETYKVMRGDKNMNLDILFPREIALPDKLYDDKTLLYFVFNHDIAKLDPDLSSKIYEFYKDLFKADDYRTFIDQNRLTEDGILQLVIQKKSEIKEELILKCGDNIKKIRDELKEIYDL